MNTEDQLAEIRQQLALAQALVKEAREELERFRRDHKRICEDLGRLVASVNTEKTSHPPDSQ